MKIRTKILTFAIIALVTSIGSVAAVSQNPAYLNPLMVAYILLGLGGIIHLGIIRNY